MNSFDFTTDNALAFIPILKTAGVLPDWVKEIPQAEDVKELASLAFADTENRLMPLHTKQAAYLSAVSAYVYDHPAGGWLERLKVACRSYGIEDEVKKAHALLAPEPYQKEATEKTEKRAHALELDMGEGNVRSYYPIDGACAVEESAEKMARDMTEQRLPGSWFVEAAQKLVKAAADYNVPSHLVPAAVQHLAEDRLPSPSYLQEQVERRIKYAALDEQAAGFYTKAAKAALDGEIPVLDAMRVWEHADRQFGVKYATTLVHPTAAFRSGISRADFDKAAGAIVTIAGIPVPFNQLSTLPDRLVTTVLPRKIAATVLHAKHQEDGLKAAAHLQRLEESEQLELLSLLTETAGA